MNIKERRIRSVGEKIADFLNQNPPPEAEIREIAYWLWERRNNGRRPDERLPECPNQSQRDWENARIIWAARRMSENP